MAVLQTSGKRANDDRRQGMQPEVSPGSVVVPFTFVHLMAVPVPTDGPALGTQPLGKSTLSITWITPLDWLTS